MLDLMVKDLDVAERAHTAWRDYVRRHRDLAIRIFSRIFASLVVFWLASLAGHHLDLREESYQAPAMGIFLIILIGFIWGRADSLRSRWF